MEETKVERAKRFAKIWWSSRADAGKSQEYMAIGIGVSKKTIQNWEKGVSSPSLLQSVDWFNLLGKNPLHYYLAFLYPTLFGDLSPQADDEKIEEALIELIKDSTSIEKRQLLYLMSGSHGSSWYCLLQMFTAHCHTTMQCRVTTARNIKENYEMNEKRGDLVCPENVRPDLSVLEAAINQGKQAVFENKSEYSTPQAE
ncbi:MAG: helix-turn-helix transcriptional regulator [Ruminococcus sp.]